MPTLWIWAGIYFIVITALVSGLLTRLSMSLARRWGVLDHPKDQGSHTTATPLLGGLAVAGAVTLVIWGHMFAGQFALDRPEILSRIPETFHKYLGNLIGVGERMLIIFGGGLAIFLIGLADDVKNLSVRMRIYPQFLVAAAVVTLGIRPSLGFLPVPFQYAVSIVWLVGITNSFNLIDGIDGLAAGLGTIASLVLGLMMLMGNHPAVAVFFFALGGACVGFLAFNWHPAKSFLGSAGSLFIGYMLGAATMVATFMSEDATGLFPLSIPLLVFAVPLYDTASVILIRFGMGRSIFMGDRSHFHHRLMRIGFSVRQTVAFQYALALVFGFGALLISRASALPTMIVICQAGVLIGLIILMERVVSRVMLESQKTSMTGDQHQEASSVAEPGASNREARA